MLQPDTNLTAIASTNTPATLNNNNNNNAAFMDLNNLANCMFVGPYRLEKTLGKGQTGLVKLGVHYKTGKKVAIKIVNREKLNESVLMKVEREITIMKLIEHPNVLRLYDVYENKKYLYLILEHVSGGELFDYLVKKSRLTIKEARKFFKQIISALDFCHSHLICHRDLKPENLLLDDKLNIKIADFGMASLQVDGSMLETSCGSPHYACPEVIKGEKYDGRKADVWSCGVILYALLVGNLPFDDDNLRHLLEKIKKGTFNIPPYISLECQELIRSMIEVDPNKRITLEQVNKHRWVTTGSNEEIELEQHMCQVVQTAIIPSREHIDTDVLAHMTSLGCFKDNQLLIEALLNNKHNIEKVIYFLLLERKLKSPSQIEDDEALLMNATKSRHDMPRKRIDTFDTPYECYQVSTIGSPPISRRGIPIPAQRHRSCHTTPLQSPCASPLISSRADFTLGYNFETSNCLQTPPHSQQLTPHHPHMLHKQSSDPTQTPGSNRYQPQQPIRTRFSSFKQSVFATPKFYRRKQQQQQQQPPQQIEPKPNESPNPSNDSKSWYQRWNFVGSNSQTNSNQQLPTNSEKEKDFVFIVNDRPLNNLKADLIHAFLSTSDLSHNINSPTLFRCDYKPPDKFLSRNVRFKVEIINENQQQQQQQQTTFKLLFTLTSGSTRQFHQLCQHICQLITNLHTYPTRQQQQRKNVIIQQLFLQQQQQQQVPSTSSSSSSSSALIPIPSTPTQQHSQPIPIQINFEQQQQQQQQYHHMSPYRTNVLLEQFNLGYDNNNYVNNRQRKTNNNNSNNNNTQNIYSTQEP